MTASDHSRRDQLETVVAQLGIALFGLVPDAELRALAKRIEVERFPADAYIVREGDLGATWYVIGQGSVDVLTNDLIGQETLLATLGVGESFGEIALVQGGRRTASVRAREAVELVSLRRDDFSELAEMSPAFADQVRSRVDLMAVSTFLRKASPLARLPRDVVHELAGKLERGRAVAGEFIVREGDPGDQLYLVRSGRAEVIERGRHVGYLGMGDCFGEVALLGAGKRTATVRAVEQTDLLVLSRTAFEIVVGEHGSVGGLMAELARIRSYIGSVPRPTLADPVSRLAPIVALDRRRSAWIALVVGIAVFSGLSELALRVDLPALTAATVLVGSLVGPVAFSAFLAEANILSHRARTLVAVFVVAGAVGVPLAVLAEQRLGLIPGQLGVAVVGALIEEPLKLVGVVWLVRRASSRFVIDGAIYGAAAGMGFAAFENVLYGFGRTDAVGHLLGTLWARTLLAPFGHGTWTAMLCAAIWGFKTQARLRWDARLVGALALSLGLHAAWDWQALPGNLHLVWLLSVGLVGLVVLVTLLQRAAAEEAGAILALNPELADTDRLMLPSARASCRACGQAAPRGAHYCPRCGRALTLA